MDCNIETGTGHEAQVLEIAIIIIITILAAAAAVAVVVPNPLPPPPHTMYMPKRPTKQITKLSSSVICCLQLSVTSNKNCATKIRIAVCCSAKCALVICTVTVKEKSKHHRLHGFV